MGIYINKNGIAERYDGAPSAAGQSYNNASSGLTATNTQAAIDEVNANINLNFIVPKNAGARNANYRGNSLGSSVTTAQYTTIGLGEFDDLFIGDYWTIGEVNWRIAAFDYWLHTGDTECTTHHVVIVPDSGLYLAQMNTSSVTTGAYVGSAMYTDNLATAKSTINSAFGSSHILNHREVLTNSVSGNNANNYAWYDSTVDLMNESMVYGSPVCGKGIDGVANYNIGIDKSQLALFAHDPSMITNRAGWWLRDVVSSTQFALVYYDGGADFGNAGGFYGVRPAFAICA